MNSPEDTISTYLLDKLVEAGARHVFGVPGDYSLAFLEVIEARPDLQWVGNANELNAAYMADGYARITGFAVVVTTYGVGELSALNGIAGAFAESVPVLHVVGTPSTQAQRQGLPLHHSLLDGDHEHFVRAAAEMAVASAALTAATAPQEIDRVLSAVLTQKGPGYLALPQDLVATPCPARRATSRPVRAMPEPSIAADMFNTTARPLLERANSVVVVADILAARHGVGRALDTLIRENNLRGVVTSAGKGVLDESAPGFDGLYIGGLSEPSVRSTVEEADVVIGVGLVTTDLSSGLFTARLDKARLIDVGPRHSTVGGVGVDNFPMAAALEAIRGLVSPRPAAKPTPAAKPAPLSGDPATALSQERFWARLATFLRSGDIVATDQGTSSYGMLDVRFPAGVDLVAQPLWSSIGYALPAAGGAQLGTTPKRRAVLVTGDGAAQLTIQELGTMAELGLDPVVIVINNAGYTIERALNGWNAKYNDITTWDWQHIAPALGIHDATYRRATTTDELDDALDHAERHPGVVRIVDVILDKHDMPRILREIGRVTGGADDSRSA